MRRMPSLIALRFFEETARHLSFSRAAAALCVTQGAVSRQIRLLEDELGARLFERDHKGIRLTDAGARLLPDLSTAFDAIEHAAASVERAAPDARRTLTLSLPPTFATRWFSPRLGALADTLPEVALSIRTSADDGCDCVIRFGRDPLDGVASARLMVERHVLVGAPRFAAEPLAALLARVPALHVLHEGRRLAMWDDWLACAGWAAGPAAHAIEFSTLDQAIQAARQGVGLAVVNLNMLDEALADGRLVRLSPVEAQGPLGYWLDILPAAAGRAEVVAFAAWLRAEAARRD
jgi:LysR family transcriptional regulator, glycine cleavage system transcriptional activator